MCHMLNYPILNKSFVSKITNLFVPRNIEEALNDENWNLAVQEEMRALMTNNTWGMVNLPTGKNVVGCK